MPSQEEIRAAMALYDTNGDGKLSPDELKAILCRPVPGGTLRSEEEVDHLVRSFDKNGDGMLSMEELADAWAELGLGRPSERVEYTDTDGDNIVFLQDADGLHYYVNGTLKVRKLTVLWVNDQTHTIHLNGSSAGPWSANRITRPADRSVCGKVLRIGRGGAQVEPVEGSANPTEYSFKDTDGDHITFRYNSNGRLDYLVNHNVKCTDLTALQIIGRTVHLKGTPAGNWSGNRTSTPNSVAALDRIQALRDGDTKLIEALSNIPVRLVKTKELIARTAHLDLTSNGIFNQHWKTYGGISEIFDEDCFLDLRLRDLSKNDYAVLTYVWEGSYWKDMSGVLKQKVNAPYVWVDIFCLNQCLPTSEKMRVIKESGSIYADAAEYHLLGLMCLDRLWCNYELALGVSPIFSAGDDFGEGSKTTATEQKYLMELKQRARRMRFRDLRVDSLLKPLSPRFQDTQCTVETDRPLVQQQIINQHGSLDLFNERLATILAGNARWHDHVASISSALQQLSADDTASEVAFVDTDGDAIVFSRKANGKLDYFVNGAPKVTDLTSLKLQGGTLHLNGTSAGRWESNRVTTPRNYAAAGRVMGLYSGQRGGGGVDGTVAFKDTDGDAIVFSINANGKLNYYVNNKLKVYDLTRCSERNGTIHLNGTSAGNWESSRVTTPHNEQTLKHVLKLAAGRV
jgi:hypothetical protein